MSRLARICAAFAIGYFTVSVAQTAPARTVTLTVTGPTTYEDGTSIPAGKVVTYNTYVGACNTTLTRVGSGVGATSTMPNVTPGQCIAAEAVVDGAIGPATQVTYHGKPGAVTVIVITG